MEKIGERLKEYRKNSGLTQSELADRVGCSAQVISNIERSYCGLPSDLAARIADVLHISADRLLRESYTSFSVLSPTEKDLVRGYRKLSADERILINSMIDALNNKK